MVLWKRKRSGDSPDGWEKDEREDPFDDPFSGMRDDVFMDFDEQFRRMRAQMNSMMENAAQSGLTTPQEGGPYVYGWSMRMGPDGVPHVRTFGNFQNPAVRAGNALPGMAMDQTAEEAPSPTCRTSGPGVREPLTDICADDGNITVTAEMPGIEKENIDIETGEDFLIISVEKGDRRYYKDLELPSKVVSGSAKANYNNGVLEITLQKAAGEKNGTRVQID
jgi:HSP20 family protein